MVVLFRDGIVGLICAAALLACSGDGGATDDAAQPDALVSDATPAPDAIDARRIDATPVVPGETCANPIILTPGDSSGADTTLMLASGFGSCSPSSSGARDAIFRFEIGDAPKDLLVTVSVDESAKPPFDVVLYARRLCSSSAEEIACSDVGWGESAAFLDVTGPLFVFVDGSSQFGGMNEGTFTLTSALRDIVDVDGGCDPASITSRCAGGNRCVGGTCVADSALLACSSATDITTAVSGGGFSATATTHSFEVDFYKGPCPADDTVVSPEHIYFFTVDAASTFVATTNLSGTQFDTYLYLRSTACDGAEIACNDDVDLLNQNLTSTLNIPDLQPGNYYLFVDGSSPGQNTGQYELSVTLTAN